MTAKVTFGQIHRLLGRLGFVRTPVEGPHVLFEHKPSGALLVFRPHRLSERVDAMTLSIVQKTLDEYGLLDRDEFEEALRKASPRRGPKAKRK